MPSTQFSESSDPQRQSAGPPPVAIDGLALSGHRAAREEHLEHSYEAFLRDLSKLLASHPYEWAAYTGDTQIAVGPSQRELYRHCLNAGYSPGSFLICSIEPPQQIVLDELPDV